MVGTPFTDVSDMINICTGTTAEMVPFYKSGLQNGAALGGTAVAGRMHSMWRWDGVPGAASQTAPTTAVVVTNATAGSLQQATPASSAKKRLLGMTACGIAAGTLILYDRLVQHGGMAGNTGTAQTTNLVGGTSTPALTRRTSGLGVEIWLEIYTLIGTTGTTVTCNYTDTTPAASTTQAVSIGATGLREQDRLIPVALASGDRGVQTVTNLDLAATTGTVGDIGITLAYPIVILPMAIVGVGTLWSSFLLPGGAVDLGTDSNACLAFAWFANTTTAPQVFGQAYFAEK